MRAPIGRPLVRRTGIMLRPDPHRVITKMFMPGQEVLIRGDSRAEPVIRRITELPEQQVREVLDRTLASFGTRHRDLHRVLMERFAQLEPRFNGAGELSDERRLLAGAYFTMEFAVEAAALFNPSMVLHPDQSGLPDGSARFVMSVRAVGEGHISSIEFRTGTVDARGEVRIDPTGSHTVLPEVIPTTYAKEVFLHHYGRHRPDGESADFVFDHLPDVFDADQLATVLKALRHQADTRPGALSAIERFEWMARSTYSIRFPADSAISDRVIHPIGPAESHGLEDVRLTRYTSPDGSLDYRGTYTAFAGDRVEPHLIRTPDFRTFHTSQLAGTASQNKGMALFPRQVRGTDLALSRWDRENVSLARSRDYLMWDAGATVDQPGQSWNLIQTGNCGPPLETPAGWLVLTHGVGPMRQYGISAVLLDLADPGRVIGRLAEPLLTAEGAERVGYVPNVVYSCGGMLHGEHLVLPYGCSDSSISVAVVALPQLLDTLRGS